VLVVTMKIFLNDNNQKLDISSNKGVDWKLVFEVFIMGL